MNGKILVLLLALVAGLLTVLYFTDEKPPVDKVAQANVLDGRTLMDCKWLRWSLKSRPPVEVTRRQDGLFDITEPLVDLASSARMKQLIDAWDPARMQAANVGDDATSLQAAGLAEPEAKLTAQWPDGTTIEVDVGGLGPLGDRETRYVRRAGKVFVAHAVLLESLRMGLDDLRERVVFRSAFTQANELQIDQRLASGQREKLHLRRAGDWQLVAPVAGRADPEQSQVLVSQVLGLRIDDFVTGKFELPSEEPTLVVTVDSDVGQESVRLWERGGQLLGYQAERKLAFVLADNQYSNVFTGAVDRLRARVLIPVAGSMFESLAEFVVDPGQGRARVRLVRDSVASGWRLVEPIEAGAADTAVAEGAHSLQQLLAMRFVDEATTFASRAEDPRFGLLPKDRLVVTVKSHGQQKPVTLWLGAETEFAGLAARYACRADEPNTVVLVPRDSTQPLQRSFEAYCALRIVQITPPIERLDLERADGSSRRFENVDGTWRLTAGGPAADRAEVGELANDELRDLVGTRAVDVRGEAFRKPAFVVKLMRRSGDEFGRLLVHDRGPDARGEPQSLLLQFVPAGPDQKPGPIAFEIGSASKHSLSQRLRELWQ
jgi:hypothetical protein